MDKDIIKSVRQALINNVDEHTKNNGQRVFKEAITTYGVKVPVVNKISKKFFNDIKNFDNTAIFDLCEMLWQSGYLEESFIAGNWAYYIHERYKPDDFLFFERWVNNYVSNWASCDNLCNHAVGAFIEMYPTYINRLKEWAQSENRWVKRAAAVTLIIPTRKGLFLNDIFEIAQSLLCDADDLVRKGYGWMLKAASETHQKEVFDFIMVNKHVMPRTSLRYAIEKMPKELKDKAMEK